MRTTHFLALALIAGPALSGCVDYRVWGLDVRGTQLEQAGTFVFQGEVLLTGNLAGVRITDVAVVLEGDNGAVQAREHVGTLGENRTHVWFNVTVEEPTARVNVTYDEVKNPHDWEWAIAGLERGEEGQFYPFTVEHWEPSLWQRLRG